MQNLSAAAFQESCGFLFFYKNDIIILMGFIFDYKNIILIIIALCNLVLGFFVLFNGLKRNRKINFYYFLLSIVVSLWAFGMIMYRGSVEVTDKIVWCRWLYVFATLLPTVFIFFCYNFSGREIKFRWWYKLIILVLNYGAIWISLWPTGGVITDVTKRAFFEDQIIFGPLYMLYNIYVPAMFAWGFWILYYKYRQADGIAKMQIKYVFWGTFLSSALGMSTNLILPTFDYFELNWLGQALTLVMVGFIAYAIIRYRLMDIKMVFSKSIIYFFLVLFVTGLFSFFTLWTGSSLIPILNTSQKVLFTVVISFVVVLVMDPLKRLLAFVTDKIFFRTRIDHIKVIKTLTDIIALEIDKHILVNKLCLGAKQELRVATFKIYLKNKTSGVFAPVTVSDKKENLFSIAGGKALEKHFNKNHQVIFIEEFLYEHNFLGHKDRLLKHKKTRKTADCLVLVIAQIDADLIVPIFHESVLTAFFTVGKKLSGEQFDKQDLNLLDSVASQFSSALEKAELYSESQKFSQKLKNEVEKATSDLRHANEHLKKLDEAKTEFISVASHQLRTPLSGIKGYLSMLKDGDFGVLEPKKKKIVSDVLVNTERMVRLVNIFLNISRIESGRLKLEKTKFDITDMTKETLHELKTDAECKGLKLEFVGVQEKIVVNADRDKLHDVLMNLVDNSIKYTAKGTVTVGLQKKDDLVKITVSDTGIGITQDDIDDLFTKFGRGKKIAQINTAGSGLGLFIAKKIVELHDGKIWAESDGEGKGSAFSFEIPVG
ncbi:MAG TPA: ATP-binding protein [bacterium]|nr:ATP-binding protein [bacterium]